MSDTIESILAARRERVGRSLRSVLGDSLLVIGAGEPVPLPESTDQTYPYRSHAEFFYFAGMECPGAVLAFDPYPKPEGEWRLFVPEITEGERVWEGRIQAPGEPLTLLFTWLTGKRGRAIVNLGEPLPGLKSDAQKNLQAREILRHARRPKDSAEKQILRHAAAATSAGYAALQPLLKPGATERELQIELEAAFFRAGATGTGYGSIVGIGSNSAILHSEPSARAAKEGDFILIDAGAERDRYVCDVTRTYVIGGKPTAFQSELLAVVLRAEQNAIARCVPGAEWTDLHLRSAIELTEGLVSMGILKGRPETLVENDAHLLFYPHGLGHLVGLGVRDASGVFPGRTKNPKTVFKTLRSDLPLAPGYVTTVEPGLYFIPALLNDPARRERFRTSVNWTMVDQHLHLGGVRIEDNVLIADDGPPEILTAAIPHNR